MSLRSILQGLGLAAGSGRAAQYSSVSDFGLMFYNARWMDPSLGRFASADSIVPDGVQGYDRYAYGLNNPVKYTDPSGHWVVESNRPNDEARRNAFQNAYERERKDGHGLSGFVADYYMHAAAYYHSLMNENPGDAALGPGLLRSKADAARMNGWNSEADSRGLAWDFGLLMAPEFLGPATIGLAGLFPTNKSALGHIFRDAPGHFAKDSPGNGALIADTVHEGNLIGTDIHGNQLYAKTQSNGTEIWVKVRNGTIQNARLNQTPRYSR